MSTKGKEHRKLELWRQRDPRLRRSQPLAELSESQTSQGFTAELSQDEANLPQGCSARKAYFRVRKSLRREASVVQAILMRDPQHGAV